MTELSTYAHHISRILKVLVYIEDHLDEPLSLEKMAKLAHVSFYYFHRLFHAYMGETLGEYIKRLRLQRAAGHLQYAVFSHRGPYRELESAFDKIFCHWYPTSREELADVIPFCEHLNLKEPSLSDADRMTNVFIPLAEK